MSSGIVIIRTSGKKSKPLPWPPEPWYKGLNNNQRIDFIAKLDWLDKAVTRATKDPQRAG